MKTRISSLTGSALLVVLVGLLLAANRIQGRQTETVSNDTTDSNAATADTNSNPQPFVPPVATVPIPVSEVASTSPPPVPNAVKLSKGAADIARFAQSGITEDVMLAYVATVNSAFSLGSDQIVYLNDLGVSGNVVKAMIQRDAAIDAAAQAYANSITPPPPNPYPSAPADTATNPAPDDSTTPPTPYDPNAYVPSDDAEYFYTSLSPYGNWQYVPGAGLCWQPTVYIGNHDWHPYNDRGRWLYTDCGWYWQSDYSWGWAAFHYGRWFEAPGRGWVWCPDRVWGPAWVSWRTSGEYCGWAPLPPSARFVPGTGFVFANHAVAAGFEFGLKAHHYTFIPIERMADYNPARFGVARWQAEDVRNRTAVVTQMAEQNHRAFSRGVDPNAVAAAARTEIRRAEVREVANDVQRAVLSDRLSKSGGGFVIYRPALPAPTRRVLSGAGGAPAAVPTHNFGGPKASITSPTPNVPDRTPTAPAAPQNEQLAARLKALQEQAVAHQREREAIAQKAETTETYPPGSLIMHGNEYANAPARPAGYAVASETPGWQPTSPSRSYGGYSVVNGFARPAQPAAPQSSQATYVMPGRFTAGQRMAGYSAPYSATSTSATPMNSHAEQVSSAANYSVPARFSVAQQLNNAPVQNGGGASQSIHNAHAEQIMEAASHNAPEPRHESTHVESHNESHSESHAAPSSPPASHSSPAPSSGGSSGGSSGKK